MGWNRRVVSSKPTVPKPQQLRMRGKEGSYPGGFGDPLFLLRALGFILLCGGAQGCWARGFPRSVLDE